MVTSKNLIVISMLLILLSAAPIMAAEKGSGRFSIAKPVIVAGSEIQPGDYNVKYEVGEKGAAVVFSFVGNPTKVEVQGDIERLDKKSDYNAAAIGKNSAGNDAILYLLFRGKDIKIVFE